MRETRHTWRKCSSILATGHPTQRLWLYLQGRLFTYKLEIINFYQWSCFLVLLGMTPEQVVYEAVRMLLYNVNSGSCIDDMLQDQVRSQLLCMCHYCFHCF